MKYVWATLSGLCVVVVLYGIYEDVSSNSFNEDSVMVIIALLVLAYLFFRLYRRFKNRSVLNETKEKVNKVVNAVQDEMEHDRRLSPALLERKRRFQLIALSLVAVSVCIIIKYYDNGVAIIMGTLILIAGITVWFYSDAKKYNKAVGNTGMITFDSPVTIRTVFNKFKEIDTPLGKPWIGKLKTLKQKAMIFGPDKAGNFVYFWLNEEGIVGYIGYSFIEELIDQNADIENIAEGELANTTENIAEGTTTEDEKSDDNAAETVENDDILADSTATFSETHYMEWLSKSITNYSKTGKALPYK